MLSKLKQKLSGQRNQTDAPPPVEDLSIGQPHAAMQVVDGAIVQPVSSYTPPTTGPDGKRERGHFDGGLFDHLGRRLKFADSSYLGHDNARPATIPTENLPYRKGTYLFLGLVQNVHFGHFISENLSRIWGTDLVGRIDGVIIITRYLKQPLQPYIVDFLNFLLPGVEIVRVASRTRFERVIVPEAIRFGPGYMKGGPVVRSFFHARTRAPNLLDPSTPSRLFVSRAALRSDMKRNKSNFVCEGALDDLLKAEGYSVFYPEQHSPAEQFRFYNNAEKLIFAEGSAFHAFVLTAKPEQVVYCLWRRKTMFPVFQEQLMSFSGQRLRGTSVVRQMFCRKDAPGNIPWALSELDFDALRDDLVAEGMISGTAWVSPSAADLAASRESFAEIYDLDAPF